MNSIPPWYYNEFKQIGTDYNSPEEVYEYDIRMKKLRNINNELDYIIDNSNLGSNDIVLEFGCGTGEFLLKAASHCRLVYGLDVSTVMLDYTQDKINKSGLDNIKLLNAGFLSYQHNGEPFDLVVSQLALHHLPDFWKSIALNRVYSILKPGAYFFLRDVVFSSDINDYDNYFCNWFTSIPSDGEISSEMLEHVKNEYSTLDWIMEGLLKKSGLNIEKFNTNGLISTYLCRKL